MGRIPSHRLRQRRSQPQKPQQQRTTRQLSRTARTATADKERGSRRQNSRNEKRQSRLSSLARKGKSSFQIGHRDSNPEVTCHIRRLRCPRAQRNPNHKAAFDLAKENPESFSERRTAYRPVRLHRRKRRGILPRSFGERR